VPVAAAERLHRIREQLDPPPASSEARTLETGGVPILVRRRADRYYLDDRGRSVTEARALGAPSDWPRIAKEVVAQEGFNVSRRGVVFVTIVHGRRDVPTIALRLAESSEAVREALLDAAAQASAIR
jgi:hypothetical protein